jgi:hypothetical protein
MLLVLKDGELIAGSFVPLQLVQYDLEKKKVVLHIIQNG